MQNTKIINATLIGVLVGLASGLLISFADNFEVTNSNLIIFISGMIAISGMILPGLSGSYLLLLMGSYTLIMVDSVNALYFTLSDIFTFNFDFIYYFPAKQYVMLDVPEKLIINDQGVAKFQRRK